MDERPIGRDVISRDRFSRLFSLGDRNDPASFAPGLVIGEDDPDFPISIAPFSSSMDNSTIPSSMKVRTRANLCFPFDSLDTWEASQGLVLPPSLVDSNSGEFGSGIELVPVTWNSLHHDQSLLTAGLQPSVIVLTDSPQLSSNPGLLEKALLTIRTTFPSSLIWTPGIGGPDNCALLSWMGADIFDLARSRQSSSLGVLLSETGPRLPEQSTNEDSSMDSQKEMWIRAISATRSAIRSGSLRDMAERQSTSSPRSVERLRRHDQLSFEFSEKIGLSSSSVYFGKKLRCHSFESRNDVTIRNWREDISENYEPSSRQRDVLVLLPCSAKKPYRLSQSHSRFRRAIGNSRAHEVMVTAPLGLVPRDLEDLWPASHYDIPVTGDWDEDELSTIRSMISRLVERVGYSTIVNHSGIELLLGDMNVIDTRMGGSAGSSEALERLRDAISSSFPGDGGEADFSVRDEKMKSISRFQFGSDKWLEGCQIRGRPPIFTITKDGVQMAKWDPRRGRFLLSKASLETMRGLNLLKSVEIHSGLDWVGDIFPSMIASHDSSILVGDEILVIQDGKLIGSARALAPGWEWPLGPGKLAKSRHRL
jgi:archaeosine synthase|tara:strand:+ start:5461 stop:7239 length:1779 start_codon:yes stop_codon:yes gene_type:complete